MLLVSLRSRAFIELHREISIDEKRVLITKDNDFLETFLLKGRPDKLILVKTGNIRNTELLKLFTDNLARMIELLAHGNLVEVTRSEITLHK